ncbi:response regulator [Paenibacillus chungangensis]|uniref:Response regulator n=1 Tax=Paenibacillus chungangensis TaxID=696535 RepID=A0ABW3HT82_9BACL
MEVVGTASSGKEAVQLAHKARPDIMLIDIEMETETSGLEAIEHIKRELLDMKIIVLTIHAEDDVMFRAYGAGAMDFIVKTNSISVIIDSIRSAYNNRLYMRPEIAEKILGELTKLQNEKSSLIYTLNIISKLTATEFEIVRAIYDGSTYKSIASERSVEEVTIRTQVNKILKKFNKGRMSEVVAVLRELKVFDIYSR